MRDFISKRDINVQELLFMARAAEANERQVTMGGWFPWDKYHSHATLDSFVNSCGTAGCLVGTYCCAKRDDWSRLAYKKCRELIGMSAERFGLSLGEANFLFKGEHLVEQAAKHAAELFPVAAIKRLRKFLYYKMRKSELLADYDKARRHEGDSMFCRVTGDERLELATV